MPDLPRYHLSEQRAHALLQPVQAGLRELTARTHHYQRRLNLAGEADRAALAAAERALAGALAEVERLVAAGRADAGIRG